MLVKGESKLGGRRWGLDMIDDVPQVSGVYVLFNQGKRIVIEESENLRESIKEHAGASPAPFTEFTWYKTTPEYGRGLAMRLRKIYRRELKDR